ncbi:MAG TPA: serine/threonine-protein kinase, partial [Polyangia bacterium]|nr:serine/threonine-protein kinase [Polyangia bacterium]
MASSTESPADGPRESMVPRGAVIGRYIALELIGRGGMGEVYAAYDPELDRKIAIKLLRGTPGSGGSLAGADSRTRLMREAKAIAKLSHPNVIVVYDVGTFEDRVFVAMEFVDGHTFNYWLNAERRHWSDILKVFVAAGRGLGAAHDKQLVHRDFKPDNVMIRSDGQVRVMDFGLARLADRDKKPWIAAVPAALEAASAQRKAAENELDSTRIVGANGSASDGPLLPAGITPSSAPLDLILTRTGSMLGTPAYMAPEQFLGRATDARTDQFSFCVALYEALYAQRPFAGQTLFALTANVVQGFVTQPPAQSPVPVWLRDVLMRGLSVAPEDRWPSMDVLLAELEKNHVVAGRRKFEAGAARKLAGIWEAPVGGHAVETAAKAEMRRAFMDTGKLYAKTAFENASRVLDRYAEDWTTMYADACEATHVRHEQSAETLDLRIAFLQEALGSLKALCRLFREARGEVVENAVSAASALPRVERAADVEVLRAVVKPPADPAARETVEQLRARLAEIRALVSVGRVNDARKTIDQLEPEVRQVQYDPLLAETLLLAANIHFEHRESELATRLAEDAVWTAELARHDEVTAEATAQLVGFCSDALRPDLADIWARHAETTIKRMGGHDLLWSWLLNNRAILRHRQGRIEEALADATRAIAAKEKAQGPDSADLAVSLGNISIYLADGGDIQGALTFVERALRIQESHLGADHPRTAINLTNYSEYLGQLGRYDEARVAARRALSTFERETDPDGIFVTSALMALAFAHLGDGMLDEARPLVQRVMKNRETNDNDPGRLGEVHFAMARVLAGVGDEPAAARTLAERARDEYQRAPRTALTERRLRE